MTREIKFRAWDIKENKMFTPSSISFKDGQLWVCDSYGDNKLEYEMLKPNGLLMQYTGLKDKNGVEIYEGDIISEEAGIFQDDKYKRIGLVEWNRADKETGMWELHTKKFVAIGKNEKDKNGISYYEPFGLACGVNKREVIGNIYQNPELLS